MDLLVSMGFDGGAAANALASSGGDVEIAIAILVSAASGGEAEDEGHSFAASLAAAADADADADSDAEDAPGGWPCPRCTLRNNDEDDACQACGWREEPPPAPVAIPVVSQRARRARATARRQGGHDRVPESKLSAALRRALPKPVDDVTQDDLRHCVVCRSVHDVARLKAWLLSPASLHHEDEGQDDADADADDGAGGDGGLQHRRRGVTGRRGGGSKRRRTTLTQAEVGQLFRAHVPDVDQMRARDRRTPVLTFAWNTYQAGLPLFAEQPALNAHLVHAMQFVVDGVHAGRLPPSTLARLSDCFRSCQAEQARVIDSVYGACSARDADLRTQVLGLLNEQKERVLEETVLALHPAAARQGDGVPAQQVPHLVSAVRVACGSWLGLRGIEHAASDYCATALDAHAASQAAAAFQRLFSVKELCQSIISDVNQQDEEAERLLDRKKLTDWSGDEASNNGFNGHRIFYDDEQAELWPDGESPKEGNQYQPFLCMSVVLDMLMCMLVLNET